MFASIRKAAKAIIESKKEDDEAARASLAQSLPPTYTITDLSDSLTQPDNLTKQEAFGNILVIWIAISNSAQLKREPNDEQIVNETSKWIAQAILPDKSLVSETNEAEKDIASALALTHRLEKTAFGTLATLSSLSPPPPTLDPAILLAAIVFASRESFSPTPPPPSALTLLSQYAFQIASEEFVVSFLLQGCIRPLFSKSRPSTVTSTGRKAMESSAPPKPYDFEAEKRDKPWKYESVWALSVLGWIIENASDKIIKENWNLFIPPLLTLLDDPSTPHRTRGLNILALFLPRFPHTILTQTGLGPVFEDALLPTLLFLPSLTPIEESLVLLPAAYKTLLILLDARYPPTTTNTLQVPEENPERTKALDRLIRKGILPGHLHAMEHPTIMTALLTSLIPILDKLGINSVKYLKDLLPILATVLEDPFVTPALLGAALAALEALLRNAWPRIGGYQKTVLRALVLCEGILGGGESDEDGEVAALRGQLEKVARLFVVVVEADGEGDLKEDVKKLAEVNPRLGELFGVEI